MANSKRKCKSCKEYTLASTGVVTPAGFFCSFDHAIDFANSKSRTEAEKVARKKKREFYQSDIGKQHELTQRVFNRMRVLQELLWFKERGLEPYCISCGKTHMDWCCGHYKTRGSQPALRYDQRNTFLQCNRYCNQALSGNIEGNKNTRGYKRGLIYRFGDVEGQAIIDYLDSHNEPVRFRADDLIKMRADFAKEVRRIESILD